MLEVVFTYCLLSAPFQCQTTRMETNFTDNEFTQCIYKAQSYIAQYVTKDYFIKEFGCSRKSKDT